MDYQDLQIHRLKHDAFRLKADNLVIYIDPYDLKEQPLIAADFILITHDHFDHCSLKDIKRLLKASTVIVASEECKKATAHFIGHQIQLVKPNQKIEFDNIKIKTVPAYNLNKFRSEGVVYHPPDKKYVGYILELLGLTIYHTGDTDMVPEMSGLAGQIDILLVPVSGTYVMTWQEAVECCKIIKPKLAIPMHYGSIVGSITDAENFKAALASTDIKVEII